MNLKEQNGTSLVRERVTALYPKIIKRFNQFKQHNIPPSADLQYHYALLAFETNISRCLELIGICGHVMKNVETATIEDSLLRPKGVAIYYSHDDDHCKDFQGVALYHEIVREHDSFQQFMSTAKRNHFSSYMKRIYLIQKIPQQN